jgi:folate-binding protein YgfZ
MSDSHLQRVTPDDNDRRDYEALVNRWGFVDLSGRTQVELLGRDRQSFLHNLCTHDIRRLRPGEGCEAFITNVQARCLGHGFVFATPESLVLDTSPAQAAKLFAHFDHYHITEDVQWIDRSGDWAELLLAGPDAPAWVAQLSGGNSLQPMYAHGAVRCGEASAWVRRVPMTAAPNYLLAAVRSDMPAIERQLISDRAARCSAAAFHMARVEQGFPWYGWDISESNLPQEVNRNQAAISFQKGCYLGQETVARIDALGHVNRIAVRVACDRPEAPPPGAPLSVDGQVVGEVTSSAESPPLGTALALAYVRRQFAPSGTHLSLPSGKATVRQ